MDDQILECLRTAHNRLAAGDVDGMMPVLAMARSCTCRMCGGAGTRSSWPASCAHVRNEWARERGSPTGQVLWSQRFIERDAHAEAFEREDSGRYEEDDRRTRRLCHIVGHEYLARSGGRADPHRSNHGLAEEVLVIL